MLLSALVLAALAASGQHEDDSVGQGCYLTAPDAALRAEGSADFYIWRSDGTIVKFDKATARRIRDRLNAALAEPFDPALN